MKSGTETNDVTPTPATKSLSLRELRDLSNQLAGEIAAIKDQLENIEKDTLVHRKLLDERLKHIATQLGTTTNQLVKIVECLHKHEIRWTRIEGDLKNHTGTEYEMVKTQLDTSRKEIARLQRCTQKHDKLLSKIVFGATLGLTALVGVGSPAVRKIADILLNFLGFGGNR